jgi:hypothetical protein
LSSGEPLSGDEIMNIIADPDLSEDAKRRMLADPQSHVDLLSARTETDVPHSIETTQLLILQKLDEILELLKQMREQRS